MKYLFEAILSIFPISICLAILAFSTLEIFSYKLREASLLKVRIRHLLGYIPCSIKNFTLRLITVVFPDPAHDITFISSFISAFII